MCRLLAYSGEPIFLEELICKPQHSLVRQSMRADEAKVTTNGDGFGIGWYTGIEGRTEPGVYREVTPAWSDENLLALCSAVRSPLFFAHVRATTGTAVARQNCHPFRYGKYLFIHNGQIGGYEKVRRQLEAALPDEHYASRKGATDSELMFLLVVAQLAKGLTPVAAIESMLATVQDAMEEKSVSTPLRFAAALSEGEHIYAVRYSTDEKPPTLYINRCNDGTIVASEPLQDRKSPQCPEWTAVAPNSAVIVKGGNVTTHRLQLRESALA
ncbi:MAG: class II glutamine amidotransferase [Burkholderiales bacterium]|nr:MAG: class II glutamine amidotransferase [Betaproteobacteria bacterium]TAG83386.1 MAG: class II glutamine amidotransferase [Burkholderiales bacterium]